MTLRTARPGSPRAAFVRQYRSVLRERLLARGARIA